MMRLPLSLFTGAVLFASPALAQKEPAAERPRLVVLCAVDQLARWVFEQGRPFLAKDGGFQRLLQQGVEFPRCAYRHACTETGPGHATIGTGVPASVHGIVRNSWWQDGKLVYCVQDPMPALPDLPEGKDRGPGRLQAPTLASSLKVGVPGSRVASVSWKDRSAILMAGRDADAVAWIEAATGNLVTNTAWAKATPAWIASFNEQKAIDGFFGQVWDRVGPEAAYAGLVDDRTYEVPHQNGTNEHTLPQPITGGKLEPGPAYYLQVFASPIGNTVVRLAAEAAVRGLELGADAAPDLLCVSFSSTDVVGHVFGPDSVEARDALLRLDQELALFMRFLDATVGAGRWALFLTADHGVGPTPEAEKAAGRTDTGRGLLMTGARAAAEQALTKHFGKPPDGKRFFTHVGEYSFYLDHGVLDALRGEREAAAMLLEASRVAAEAAAKTKGISTAFATLDLLAPSAKHDALQVSLVLGLYPGRAGDVQLVVKPYWLDGMTPASHGTPHPYDCEVAAFAIGTGITPCRIEDAITPGFGAVWFAQLLGLPRPEGAADTVPKQFGLQ